MERVKQLTMLIDHEQWTQAEIPIDFQVMVNKICKVKESTGLSKAISDSASHLAGLDITSDLIQKSKEEEEESRTTTALPKANMRNNLLIDGKEYAVVPCALLFVKMIDEYLICNTNIPSLTPEIINRVVELAKVIF